MSASETAGAAREATVLHDRRIYTIEVDPICTFVLYADGEELYNGYVDEDGALQVFEVVEDWDEGAVEALRLKLKEQNDDG